MKDGIILIDKEEGLTSRQIDNRLIKIFSTKKVGHLGTLDPFATGLLVVAVGKGTKCLPYIYDCKKRYIASLRLGISTSTGDKDGEIKDNKPIPNLDKDVINKCLSSFLGKSSQLPPMTSAIKINGEALYKKAHRGEEIERKNRDIEVYSIKLLSYFDERIIFECDVSKGTYIRTLGEDVAKKLGTVGHLDGLRRMMVGEIDIRNAKKIDDIAGDDIKNPIDFINMPHAYVSNESEEKRIKDGLPYFSNKYLGDKILIVSNDNPLAVYRKKEGEARGFAYVSERGLF